ncbi:MAG: oxidoreductase [Bacteroidetes bacterium]|nr:oxidoreductase [Bacteroidota bacterium]MBS1926692.1 oxidoreductase [Bacteroidota bacterium]
MFKKFVFAAFLFSFFQVSHAQKINLLTSGTKASFRGLSVPNDSTIWVSGSNGTVGKSTNSGKTWQWKQVPGFEKTDFRDIEASDSNTAIIMAIAEPAYILRTVNGGKQWDIVYKNDTKGMFLDAMDFIDHQHGIVVGDPINGKIFLATTNNGGASWIEMAENKRPSADSGEACFASSGTNIKMTAKNKYLLVTGGLNSNLVIDGYKKIALPIQKGKETTGANSIAYHNKKIMVAGGDFMNKDSIAGNFIFTKNKGKRFIHSLHPPSGYRSCVAFINGKTWVTCGLNGVDITLNNGKSFIKISDESFHVVQKSKTGNNVFLAGEKGKVAVVSYE